MSISAESVIRKTYVGCWVNIDNIPPSIEVIAIDSDCAIAAICVLQEERGIKGIKTAYLSPGSHIDCIIG